jgi:hypothetical protein
MAGWLERLDRWITGAGTHDTTKAATKESKQTSTAGTTAASSSPAGAGRPADTIGSPIQPDAAALIADLGNRSRAIYSREAAPAEALITIGPPAVPLLIQHLTTSDYVPYILGCIGDKSALEPLMLLATSGAAFERGSTERWYATKCACEALGLLGDERAIPLMTRIARETNVAEVHMAATEAIERIQKTGRHTPQSAPDPEIEQLRPSQRIELAKDSSTAAGLLDKLFSLADLDVDLALAKNPSTSPEILRKLNRRHNVEGRRLYYQFATHPNCPSDLLDEIVRLCVNEGTVRVARAHPHFPRGSGR